MEYYKIVIVGQSGKGKTYAARNLNPESTGMINVENKPLPFKNNFSNHTRPATYTDAYNDLITMGKNESIEAILFDSFSAYTEGLLTKARETKKGFDTWNLYNEEIGKLFQLVKRVPKHLFITAHYETLNVEGNSEKRIKVKGKEWEGLIEKEFTVVLYADSKMNETTKKPEYWLNVYQEGTSAKCPPDLFGPDVLKVPNDYNWILNKVKQFTGEIKEVVS